MKYIMLLVFCCSMQAYAKQVGVIVATTGEVYVLSKKKKKDAKQLSFQNQIYFFLDAKVGKRLAEDDYIQTGTNGKLKLLLKNGDQFFVGPGTITAVPGVSISDDRKIQDKLLELFYGKIRVVVSPKKDLSSSIRIKTKTAVAGVRGTDFSVVHYDQQGTFTSVFRGEVELSSVADQEVKTLAKTGETAQILDAPVETTEAADASKVEVKPELKLEKTSQEEVQDLGRSFDEVDTIQEQDLPEEVKAEVAELNQKAIANVKEEIAASAKDLDLNAKDLEQKTLSELNQLAIAKVEENAPSRSLRWKPSDKEKLDVEEGPEVNYWYSLRLGLMYSEDKEGDSTGPYAAWNPRIYKVSDSFAMDAQLGLSLIKYIQDFNPNFIGEEEEEDLLVFEASILLSYLLNDHSALSLKLLAFEIEDQDGGPGVGIDYQYLWSEGFIRGIFATLQFVSLGETDLTTLQVGARF